MTIMSFLFYFGGKCDGQKAKKMKMKCSIGSITREGLLSCVARWQNKNITPDVFQETKQKNFEDVF